MGAKQDWVLVGLPPSLEEEIERGDGPYRPTPVWVPPEIALAYREGRMTADAVWRHMRSLWDGPPAAG